MTIKKKNVLPLLVIIFSLSITQTTHTTVTNITTVINTIAEEQISYKDRLNLLFSCISEESTKTLKKAEDLNCTRTVEVLKKLIALDK